ncbi:MAG: hypothetical protein ACAI38_11285 [Myxococcota bacterium]|nr:hypothetical protein [Myxococcota bacterium]
MSVEGVGGKAAAVSFPIAPATAPAALQENASPAVKPARRRSFDRVRSAPLPPPFVVTPAHAAIHAGIAVLLHTGRIAAFAPGGRKGSQANADIVEHEETPVELAHDDPDRLSALRDRLSQLPPAEVTRLRELAERARDSGYGFVVEPLELPAPPGPQPETHLRLSAGAVDGALARHGRIYVGSLTSIPKPPPAQGNYQVVDASSAEAIISYEALRSYLNLFR